MIFTVEIDNDIIDFIIGCNNTSLSEGSIAIENCCSEEDEERICKKGEFFIENIRKLRCNVQN